MNRKNCPRCWRTAYYSPPPRSHCANCTPPEELRQFFRFSIRVRNLERIKAQHRDVSVYLRELVAGISRSRAKIKTQLRLRSEYGNGN